LCATAGGSSLRMQKHGNHPPSSPGFTLSKNYLYFVIHGIVKLCLILNVLLH